VVRRGGQEDIEHLFELLCDHRVMRGGYGTGEHGTLAERVAGTVAAQPPEPRPPTPPSPARHCFVDGEPSLLVEWRRAERGWEGRVHTLVWVDAVGWVTIERWLPAAEITPTRFPV
jgi:hypothetical protein